MEGLKIISWRIVTTRIVVTLLDREYHSTLFFKIYPPARFLFPEAKNLIAAQYFWNTIGVRAGFSTPRLVQSQVGMASGLVTATPLNPPSGHHICFQANSKAGWYKVESAQ